MEYSQKGLDFTARSEGIRLIAYQDSGGVWTIGVGHTKGVKKGQEITYAQAMAFLVEDVKDAVAAVKRRVKVPLTQGQFDALVDLVFNIGEEQFRTSTLLRVLNGGMYEAARMQFPRWKYDNGKVQGGLVVRREGNMKMFNS